LQFIDNESHLIPDPLKLRVSHKHHLHPDAEITASSFTLVNKAIFLRCSSGRGFSDLHTNASG
jgi:hypothetical protein